MAKKEPKEIFVISNHDKHADCLSRVSSLDPDIDKPWLVEISQQVEPRSNKQNRLSFLWYKIRGIILRTGHVHERRYCKLTFGVPLLRLHQEFNDFFMVAIDHLSYENKLKAMDYVDVTSNMSMREFADYLEAIDWESSERECPLPHPEDIYYDALMKAGVGT